MTMQFGFAAALHDNAASLSISQNGPQLIIEETDAPRSTLSIVAGVAFAFSFLAFGLFVVSWEMDAASEALRFPVAGLFALFGLGLLWLMIRRKKTIRRLIADSETQIVEYGQMVAGQHDDWQYQKKGAFDYRHAERFDTGYVDHSEPGADQSLTGLYVKGPDGPRGGLLVMGALYEIEIAVDYIYRHMNDAPQGDGGFGSKDNKLPLSFVPQNRKAD